MFNVTKQLSIKISISLSLTNEKKKKKKGGSARKLKILKLDKLGH